jgi:hypothetical protein
MSVVILDCTWVLMENVRNVAITITVENINVNKINAI